ncbi:MAG: hypothetical protein MR940_07575 [Lachnospiraceae bacterium]|nr:hypothetical protein [Lachnospiraceae bacterium]MCI7093629.1 hypothetical protein [Lachnospiraceae bacterium]
MDHTIYSYYGPVSSLPFEEILEPVNPASRKLPIEALHLKSSITEKLRRQGCRTVDDVLKMNDADVLELTNAGRSTLMDIREALLRECGSVDWHPYFDDDAVQKFLKKGQKTEPLDSRMWMAGLWMKQGEGL